VVAHLLNDVKRFFANGRNGGHPGIFRLYMHGRSGEISIAPRRARIGDYLNFSRHQRSPLGYVVPAFVVVVDGGHGGPDGLGSAEVSGVYAKFNASC
jgi:hypothetical protein